MEDNMISDEIQKRLLLTALAIMVVSGVSAFMLISDYSARIAKLEHRPICQCAEVPPKMIDLDLPKKDDPAPVVEEKKAEPPAQPKQQKERKRRIKTAEEETK
jgi:hypothetical protein